MVAEQSRHQGKRTPRPSSAAPAGVLLLVGLLLSGPASAQTDLFPEFARNNAARQLAEQLGQTYLRDRDPEELASGSRSIIDAILENVEALGVDGLVAQVPELREVGLPESGNPYLDAMARYGACSFHLDSLYADSSLDETRPKLRVTAAEGLVAIPLASWLLRHHYLAEGGDDAALEAFLASEEMNRKSLEIQQDEELLNYTFKQCSPAIAALLDF